jgi:hypothetical protein
MLELIVAEEHSQLYDLWLERGSRDLSVCNVDFHCDMRGLLIDRRRGEARYLWQNDPRLNRLDSGSFLGHAVMNGIVSNLRWVHDCFGGRKHDSLYCVKYETDFSALPYLLLNRKSGWVPISFQEQMIINWDGPRRGEHLSIDWDGIAFADYDEDRIRRLMKEILNRNFEPESIFLARSPEYSHPDGALFDEFIVALEEKFNTKAFILPAKRHLPLRLPLQWKLYHHVEHCILRQMRKLNIY